MNTRFDPTDVRSVKTETPAFGTRQLPEVEEPLTPTQARQGAKGTPVLKVLVAGIVLALIAWAGAEWWGQASAPPAEQTATPPAGQTEPVNPDATPSSNPSGNTP